MYGRTNTVMPRSHPKHIQHALIAESGVVHLQQRARGRKEIDIEKRYLEKRQLAQDCSVTFLRAAALAP